MANPQTEPYSIFYVIEGEDNSFSIEIASSEIVDSLKDLIKEENKNTLAGIDAYQLNLYHVEILDNEDRAKAVKQKLLENPAALSPTMKLATIFKDDLKEETVHIIVQLPKSAEKLKQEQMRSPDFVNRVDAVRFFTEKLGIYTVEDLRNQSNNTHLHIGAGIESSPFRTEPPDLDNHQTPSFVSVYLGKLDAKRWVSKVQFEKLQKTFGQATCMDLFETTDTVEISSIELNTYTTGLWSHLCRLNTIRGKSSTFKAYHMTVYLVDPTLTEDDGVAESWCYDKKVGWDPLLLQGTLADGESLYTFKPRDDFCLFAATYGPLIIGKTNSEERESDRWRILFEGAAVCRYQNKIREDRGAIILCLYLNKDYKMERYLVYQTAEGDTRDVHVLHDLTLDLVKVRETLLLSKYLFNFREHLILIPEMDESRREQVLGIQNLIKELYDISVSAAVKQAQSRRTGSSRPLARILSPISEDAALQVSFKAIRILHHIQKDVATAVRRSDRQYVVLKRIRTNSSELRVLRLLQSRASQGSNHIIPLLEVVKQPRGISTLVMPYYTSILYLEKGRVEELALQLIRGVDWLHKQLISHSDIKPRNLVFDERKNCLFIIDFGLAIKLTSREQEVQGARGTAEHVAPEVGITSSWETHLQEVFLDEDSIYSPILADIWAVGDVINYFRQQFRSSTESIRAVVGKVVEELQAFEPTERLSLHDAERRIAAASSTPVTAPGPPAARP